MLINNTKYQKKVSLCFYPQSFRIDAIMSCGAGGSSVLLIPAVSVCHLNTGQASYLLTLRCGIWH